MREFDDLLSEFMYDGEGRVAWPKYLEDVYAFHEDANEFHAEEVSVLLSYTIYKSPLRWC